VRLVGAVTLACASVPLTGVGTALADTAALTPSNSAYFFSAGIDKPDASPAEPPNVTGTYADGVSAGNLAVAAQGGSEDKVSFLYFDVFNLPVGATIDKAVVTMTLVPSAPPNDIAYNEAPELVQACKAGDGGYSGDDGDGLALAPARLCQDFAATGKAGAAGAYQWDVTGLAQSWLTGANDGIAFTTASADPGTNFQVVFGPASSAKLDVTYTPAVVVDPVTQPPVALPGPALPPAPSGGFAPAPSVDLGAFGPGVGTVPDPTVNPVPQPATNQPAVTALKPVALSTSLRPASTFWLAGLGLVAALVLVSLVLGDVSSPTASRRRSRLSIALADPQRLPSMQTVRHRPA
jgi:hypothetical protein